MKISSPLIKNLIFFSLLSVSFGQNLETAFLKYYLNDRDFIADVPMFATERKGKAHLEVTFNENKQPLLKRWLDNNHDLINEEMFVYNKTNTLEKRLFLGGDRRTEKIIHYGEKELWSVEFRKYSALKNNIVFFIGQQTEFVLNGSDEIHEIIFRTIDNHEYGTIHLTYDHLGFLQEEVWRILPENKIIRKFVYHFDIINNIQQIWEYGKDGSEISHVALSMAPEDKLYTTPPPRTGNVLDEADDILQELISKRIIAPIPAFIPYTDWDRITLIDGDGMDIVFVAIDENYLRFSLPFESDVLSMSLDRISSVTSKYGKRIYP
ncbi:MAG: hypothetical protein IIB45_02935 [Candidatus Marinimicrobia bacterium]|nr:hypothetical protein [Candidatus Neomarinimicrobiota bacterium]